MKCPKCNSEVRPSKKSPGYYLCDTCRKKYPAASIIDDTDEYENDFYDAHDESPRRENASSRGSRGRSSTKNSSKGASRAKNHSKNNSPNDPRTRNSGRANTKDSSAPAPKNTSGKRTRQKPKKRGGFLKVLLLLLLILVLIVICVIGADRLGYIEIKNPFSSKDKTEKTVPSDNTDTQPLYKTGETATLNDIQMKVLGYEESSGDEQLSPNTLPADGNEFVFVNIEITNNTEEDLVVSSLASFESYCGEYKLDYSQKAFTAFATNTDKQQLDGTVASGNTLSGYLCLEVPADWETLEIHYSPDPWPTSEKIQFEVTR